MLKGHLTYKGKLFEFIDLFETNLLKIPGLKNYLDLFTKNIHCQKYGLKKSYSGGFLAATMLQQDLNSENKYLQEQELKENEGTKKMQEQVLK